jgi:hypothetical protein
LIGTIATLFSGSSAYGDPLKAGTQATEVSGLAAKANPANAAFIVRSRATFFPNIYNESTLNIRYPGFKSIQKKNNGFGGIPLFAFVPKLSEKSKITWAITEILPPVSVPITVEEVPLVILGQVNLIDVNAIANVKYGIGGLMAYRFSDQLGVGLLMAHRAIGVDVGITETGTGKSVADVNLDIAQTEIRFGTRYQTSNKKFAVGLSSIIFQSNETKTTLSSPLTDSGAGGGAPEAAAPAPLILAQVLGGVSAHLKKISLHLDIEYIRANTSDKAFSLVDFTEKPRDVYDTVSVRAGAGATLNPTTQIVGGFAYVPASVGPGSQGVDGKAGFGMLDLVMVFAGLEDLKPYTAYVFGMRRGFGFQRTTRKIGKKVTKVLFPQWIAGVGVGFQKSSLGIDESGEQPGAFQQTKVYIPAQITYQF